MSAKLRLFKVLHRNGTTIFGRAGWTIPDGEPSPWMPPIEGDLRACENGYHLTDALHLACWARERNLLIIECDWRDSPVGAGDKYVVRAVRPLRRMAWTEKTLIAWACDCAERALAVFEKRRPGDGRPRECIATVRAWLHGKATNEQVRQVRNAADAAADAAAAADARFKEQAWQAQRMLDYLDGKAQPC